MYEDCPALVAKPADPTPAPTPACSVAIRVASDVLDRSAKGTVKYGVTLGAAPLTKAQTIRHAYEEALDLACYLQKLMDMEDD